MDNYSIESSLQTQFQPLLESLEFDRKAIVDRNYTIMCISAGVVFAGALFAFSLQLLPIFIGSVVIGLLIYFSFSDKGADEWAHQYKQNVINAIVKSFFAEQGQYEPQNGHTVGEFIDTQLFDRLPDRYHAEDLIKGRVDKTAIYFSEVFAEYETTETVTDSDTGKTEQKSTWHTLFNGILFTADFNKHFQGCTIVKEKGFWGFGSYGNVELENPIFRDVFAVNADDSIEARYILSPALMEKIIALNNNWGGALGFSFVRSQMTIAIPKSENFFEISVWSKIDTKNQWHRDWQIIADLISVVSDLDLNTRIWTKE
jgi:hypothetical protein